MLRSLSVYTQLGDHTRGLAVLLIVLLALAVLGVLIVLLSRKKEKDEDSPGASAGDPKETEDK
ncbi:MAG: hypothetical protein LBJ11_07540 [Oscillospiraceae bacterium]|nr:hypothetical protein [Oscillospiraceae bacterium]